MILGLVIGLTTIYKKMQRDCRILIATQTVGCGNEMLVIGRIRHAWPSGRRARHTPLSKMRLEPKLAVPAAPLFIVKRYFEN